MKRFCKGKSGDTQIFSEISPGDVNEKLHSWHKKLTARPKIDDPPKIAPLVLWAALRGRTASGVLYGGFDQS